MTPTSAPSGLKLTEEQVAEILAKMKAGLCMDGPVTLLAADWRTLRAERDEKDAEIARLKEENEAIRAFNTACEERAAQNLDTMREKWTARATRAEARLAAVVTVTEADVSALLAALPIDPLRFHARAALEAFVANKTAGGK